MDHLSKVSVIIINWNTRRHLLECLSAFELPNRTLQIVVVDNASSDGSVDAIRAAYPSVAVLANPVNRGYGTAINQGAGVTDRPYLLIANADVCCAWDAVARLADFLDQRPAVAVVGPRLVNPDGSLQLSWGREPHFLTELCQRWWWRRLEAQPGQRALRRYAAHPRPVEWVLGACLMVRRDAFEAVGQMDEQYFMYFEEADLCTRLRRAGWQVWYLPSAEVVHHGRASVQQVPEAMALAYRQSQVRYYRRCHGALSAALLKGYLRAKLIWSPSGRRLLRELAASPR